jgi:hypothetical protein
MACRVYLFWINLWQTLKVVCYKYVYSIRSMMSLICFNTHEAAASTFFNFLLSTAYNSYQTDVKFQFWRCYLCNQFSKRLTWSDSSPFLKQSHTIKRQVRSRCRYDNQYCLIIDYESTKNEKARKRECTFFIVCACWKYAIQTNLN